MNHVTLSLPLVLASASPRRAELLRQLGLPFTVLPSHIDEPPPLPGEDVLIALRCAAADKARATAQSLSSAPALVLGADTMVLLPAANDYQPCLDGKPVHPLGKPCDAAHARQMLRALSGREHFVASAFALLAYPEDTVTTVAVVTRVRFRHLSPRDIDDYVAGGEPLDKAGSYGIQGAGAVLVDSIAGDYYTVVGLPLTQLWRALQPWRVSDSAE